MTDKNIVDEQTVGDFHMVITAINSELMGIKVTHVPTGDYKSRTYNCVHPTTFGFDVSDMTNMLNTAEDMCVEFEEIHGSKDQD